MAIVEGLTKHPFYHILYNHDNYGNYNKDSYSTIKMYSSCKMAIKYLHLTVNEFAGLAKNRPLQLLYHQIRYMEIMI